ncbi:MAG: serine hydrolase [Negativicutes bacterium]
MPKQKVVNKLAIIVKVFKKNIYRSGVMIVALILLCNNCFAFSSADFDKAVRNSMADNKLVGVSIVVFQNEKPIFSKGYGYANISTSAPMSGESIFRVASLSKMIVATAIMRLYDKGRLNLDDDIAKYLGYKVRNPMYPNEIITVRQLLLHTSSIKDSGCYNNFILSNGKLFRTIALNELLTPKGKYYEKTLFSQYAPGEAFSYSNLNYGILGSIVEMVANERFDDYCKKNILLPLDMDAGFDAADIVNWQNIGVTYRYRANRLNAVLDENGNGKPIPIKITAPLGNAIGWSPTGGLRVSANDMAKFMIALANDGVYDGRRILTKHSSDMMQQLFWMGVSYDGLDEQVGLFRQEGLGLNVVDQLCDGWRLVGHSGDAYGLIAGAYFDQISKLGFVYIINGGIYKTALPQSPAYVPERTIAKAIHDRYEELLLVKPLNLSIIPGEQKISVNGRDIWLPATATVDKEYYLPLITVNDALGLAVDEGESGIYYLSKKDISLKLALKDTTITVSGYMNTYLPKAPYSKDGIVYVPLKQIAEALGIKVVYKK